MPSLGGFNNKFCFFNRYRAIQFSTSPVCFSSFAFQGIFPFQLACQICIMFFTLFSSYSSNVCTICSDVTSLRPDAGNLCLFLFPNHSKSLSILSSQRTNSWYYLFSLLFFYFLFLCFPLLSILLIFSYLFWISFSLLFLVPLSGS